MLPSKSIDKSLLDTHTASDNYDPATLGLEAYNIVRNKVINAIVLAKQDYFWERIKTDTVVGQSEYNISEILGAPNLAIKRINKVFIKYDANDTYYTPVEQLGTEMMTEDPDYYSDSQSKSTPFFNIKDRSTFIYPAATEIITEGLKLTVIYQPAELTLSEDDDKVDADKQYIYSLGIAEHIYKSQGKINESNDAKADFGTELRDFIREIKNRYNKPITKRFKDNLNNWR